MAREHKPVELRPVDDGAAKPAPVRLNNRETVKIDRDTKPIRLGPHADAPGVSQRLDLPSREDNELRSHQPGIETIIETEVVPPEQLEENWGEESKVRSPIPWGWFALIGMAIAGAVLWSLSRVQKSDVLAEQIRSATASALIQDEKEELAARQLIERINRNLKGYFNASTVETMVPLVRHAGRVAPLMRQYYADTSHPLVAKHLKSVTSLEPLTLGDYANFWLVYVVLGDDSALQVIVETTDSGEALIDWETVVCYQPMKWGDFIAQRPARAALDFRVNAETDYYYNYEFSDFKRWTCFRLTAKDSDVHLFGYAPAGSALAQEIQHQIDLNSGHQTALILRLRCAPGQLAPNSAVIEKLLSPRWIYVVPPATGP